MAYNISKVEFGFLDKKYEKTGFKCEKVHFYLATLQRLSRGIGLAAGGHSSISVCLGLYLVSHGSRYRVDFWQGSSA